ARADYAIGYSSIIADYAKGQPVSLVMASFQFSPMVLLSHEPIKDLKQLAGRSVMHYGNLQINGLIDKANALVDEKIVEVDSSGDLSDFISKKVNFYAAYQTNEPYRLQKEGVPYYLVDPKTFGIQSYGDLIFTSQYKAKFNPREVKAFKEATISGWQYAIENQTEIVDYIIENYPVKKDRSALLSEAKETSIYVQSGSNSIGHIEEGKLLATAVQAKESGLISEKEFNQLDLKRFIFNESASIYTQEELDYLAQHPTILIGNDIQGEPFEFVDEEGHYKGLAADYFKLFETKLGVKFKPVREQTWNEVLELTQLGEVDVLSCAVSTPATRQYMNFTKPYLSFPMVLVAKEQMEFIDHFDLLSGQTVAVLADSFAFENLQRHHPDINLLAVPTVAQGLQAVLRGNAIGYSGNLASINFAIKKAGLTGLNIVGESRRRFDMAIGVHKDNPILFSILDKTLNSVTEQQHREIYDNWIQLKILHEMDSKVLIKTVGLGLLIILILSSIIVLFNAQKRKQQAYIQQINELSMATYTNIQTRTLEWVSDSFVALSGYSREELLNQSHEMLRHPEVPSEFYDDVWTQLEQGQTWKGEIRAASKSGSDYWVDAVATPEIEHGVVKGFWTTRADISDKKNLQQLAIKDALTGVYNRRHFNQMFETELNRANRKHGSFAMAIFDIDWFKQINDYYGHQKGDEVLIQVMEITKQHAHRAGDLLFRVGGEEFVIISDFTDEKEFFQYLELLREAIQDMAIPNPLTDFQKLTISIGAVMCKKANQVHTNYVYAEVDKALYEAKHQGRNQVVMRII
ncbi:MAG: diguanylate cyclase, partial [Pseudomonadota bacterium]|nr:diguanylate cyclase [Pseudomonadota bacterium]